MVEEVQKGDLQEVIGDFRKPTTFKEKVDLHQV